MIKGLVAPVALFVAMALPARADSPDRPLEFVARLVAAINGKNLDRRKALLHPKSLECLTPQTAPYVDEALERQFRHTIPADHRSRADRVPADRQLKLGDGVVFPLRPTHQVQIDWKTGPQASVTLIAQIAYVDGGWRELWPCVSPESVPAMQAAKDARRQREQRAESLAAAMAPALRAELARLVAAGRKMDAIKEYQRASGEDRAVARAVVERITTN